VRLKVKTLHFYLVFIISERTKIQIISGRVLSPCWGFGRVQIPQITKNLGIYFEGLRLLNGINKLHIKFLKKKLTSFYPELKPHF